MSVLPSNLIKEFVKETNDMNPSDKSSSTHYGTAVVNGTGIYVKFDGSEILTPVSMATDAKNGDRVLVTIENHKARIVSNFTSPASGRTATDLYSVETTEDGTVVVKGELRVAKEYVDELIGNDITATTIKAQTGEFEILKSKQAEFESTTTENLTAVNAELEKVTGDFASFKTGEFENLKSKQAEFENTTTNELNAIKASIEDLDVDNLEAKYAKIEDLQTTNAKIVALEAGQIKTEYLDAHYAQIDLANIKDGSITTAMIGTGVVGTAQIADGSITDAKIVELTANKITAGLLSVERLEIRGSTNSIVYGLNNITGALQAQNMNTLNGEILTPRTITADKIVANTITANEIAAQTITANNIAAGAVTADKMSVTSLSAISANLGTITGGSLDIGSGKFKVTGTGELTATGATISGNITAKNGQIGVFNIDNALYTNANAFGTTANNIYIGSSGISLGTAFIVTNTGELTATSGTIGSYTIDNVYLKSTDQTVGMSASSADLAFWAGGSSISTTKFRVNRNGDVFTKSLYSESDNIKLSLNGGYLTVMNKTDNSTLFEISDDGDILCYAILSTYCFPRYLHASHTISAEEGISTGGNITCTDVIANGWAYVGQVHFNDNRSGNYISCGNYNNAYNNYYYSNGYHAFYVNGSTGMAWINSNGLSMNGEHGLYSNTMGNYVARYYVSGSTKCTAIGNNSYATRIYGSSVWANKAISTSDERLKTDFKSLDEMTNVFMELEPVSFKWKSDYEDGDNLIHFGLKAGQVKRTFEKYGYNTDDYSVIGNFGGYMGICYDDLFMLTMCATQKNTKELMYQAGKIDLHETIIQDLQNRLYLAEQEIKKLRQAAA